MNKKILSFFDLFAVKKKNRKCWLAFMTKVNLEREWCLARNARFTTYRGGRGDLTARSYRSQSRGVIYRLLLNCKKDRSFQPWLLPNIPNPDFPSASECPGISSPRICTSFMEGSIRKAFSLEETYWLNVQQRGDWPVTSIGP